MTLVQLREPASSKGPIWWQRAVRSEDIWIVAWLALLGIVLWGQARQATIPPVWDSLSYALKAQSFWRSLAQLHPINPFAIDPTVRPPATVLVSYPFGFSTDYQGFFFRTLFIPAALLALGVSAAAKSLSIRSAWIVVALVLVATTIPPIFQFQAADIPSSSYWGLVDCFMAGLASVAAACSIRAFSGKGSMSWAVAAIASGVLCFWTKPAGLLVTAEIMAIAGIAAAHSALNKIPGSGAALARAGVVMAVGIGGVALARFSPYFSAENLTFGKQVVAEMAKVSAGFHANAIISAIHVGIGWPMTALVGIGIILALACLKTLAYGAAASAALIFGLAFWLFSGDVAQVRYMLPFATMAFVFVVPNLVSALQRLPRSLCFATLACACLPGTLSLALVMAPSKPIWAQRMLGISVEPSPYPAATNQATSLLAKIRSQPVPNDTIYLCLQSNAAFALPAILEYDRIVNNRTLAPSVMHPMDWAHGFGFRPDQLLEADYLACETDPGGSVSSGPIESFADEYAVVRRWIAGLSARDGATLESKDGQHIVRVVDRPLYEQSIADLVRSRPWRESTMQNYGDQWLTRAQYEREAAMRKATQVDSLFAQASPAVELMIRSVGFSWDRDDLIVDIWTGNGNKADTAEWGSWRLFGQIENANGQILKGAQARLSSITDPEKIRRYRLRFELSRSLGAKTLALGFVRTSADGKQAQFMTSSTPSLADARRLITPVNVPE